MMTPMMASMMASIAPMMTSMMTSMVTSIASTIATPIIATPLISTPSVARVPVTFRFPSFPLPTLAHPTPIIPLALLLVLHQDHRPRIITWMVLIAVPSRREAHSVQYGRYVIGETGPPPPICVIAQPSGAAQRSFCSASPQVNP
ncbi:hypothetical protein E4U55_003130 [Claviceps digitariae]|nr:hypothetical protein E4U55_003130 [Claviceps digitariae]